MVENVTAQAAYAVLQQDTAAMLVDVRTQGEWRALGVPALQSCGKQTALVSWQLGPMHVNAGFLAELAAAGAAKDVPLYLICRSGARSLAAGQAAEAAGYRHVFNVMEGFEGRPGVAGWAAQNLPIGPMPAIGPVPE